MESNNEGSELHKNDSNKYLLIKEAREHYESGEKSLNIGDVEEALRQFKKANIKDPDNPFYFYFLSKAYQIMAKKENLHGFYVLAMENIKKACAIAPETVTFHNTKLEIAMKAGFVEDILKEYIELSEKNPDNTFYKDFIKRISVVNMVAISDTKKISESKQNIFLKIFLDYVLPLTGCLLFSAGYMIRAYLKAQSKAYAFSGLFYKLGIALIMIFATIKIVKFIKYRNY